jgi:hypothetical protein
MKKGTYPVPLLVRTSHNFFENPQDGKKEIENVKIPKQKTFEVSKRKVNTLFPPCETSHKEIKDPQNDKKKIEDLGIVFLQQMGLVHVRKKIS